MDAILIHVGLNKTATSWLQREVFPKLPGIQVIGRHGRGDREVIEAVKAMQYDPAWEAGGLRRAVMARTSGGRPLLSDEGLASTLRYRDASHHRDATERLRAEFPNASVLIVVRRQADLLLSSHRQYVKLGGSASLQTFCSGDALPGFRYDPALFDLDRIVATYEDLFDEVVVVAYEQFRADRNGALRDIFRWLGSEPLGPLDSSGRNISLGWLATDLLRAANRIGTRGRFEPGDGFAHAYRSPAYKVLTKIEARLPLSSSARSSEREAVERLQPDWADGNRRLDERRGLGLARFGYYEPNGSVGTAARGD